MRILILCALWLGTQPVQAGKKSLYAARTKTKLPTHTNKQTNMPPSHLAPTSSLHGQHELFEWFGTYSEVVSLVERKAFRTVDFAKFIQESLKGAVAQVDAHSSFFTHDHYKSAKDSISGQFPGIGISIVGKMPDDDALGIIDVIVGSPAQKAGIQRGDKIIQVDTYPLRGMTTDEVISKLRGEVGSTVKLKILRNKKTLDMCATREIIKDQILTTYHFTHPNVLYASLKMFSENAAHQTKQFLAKAAEKKCRGIILDLRRNPGGVIESAIEMAGLFIPKGSLVTTTKDNKCNVISRYHTSTEPVFNGSIPLCILVDSFTASAAEILAGTLRHYAEHNSGQKLMVFLVGTPTFGKGSVQEVIPLGNGCALKLTTMLYYLADDTLIQAVGIIPDFVVYPKVVPAEQMRTLHELYGSESALHSHINLQEIHAPTGVCPLTSKPQAKRQADAQQEAQRIKQQMLKCERNEKDIKQQTPDQVEQEHKEALILDSQVQASVNMIMLFDCMQKANPSLVDTRQKALSLLKTHFITDAYQGLENIS